MAKIVTITNPLTGQPAQVDQLDHTAQQIDDGLNIARGVSNPNLLDNWYFANPVNQRGATSYSGSASTGIDRWWQQYNTGVTVQDGYITVSGQWQIEQKFENPIDATDITVALLSRNLTSRFYVSVIFDDGTETEKQEIGNSESAFTLKAVTFNQITKKVTSISFSFANNIGSIDLLAAKLELGSQQTLAHQDENGNWVLNEIPDYGEQLRRCQRYFVNFNPYKMKWFAMPPAIASSANQAYSAVTLPVTMRAQPVVSYGGNIVLSQSADHAITGMIVSDETFTGNSIQLRYDVGAGTLTANSLYRVQGSNDPTSYIWLSADL